MSLIRRGRNPPSKEKNRLVPEKIRLKLKASQPKFFKKLRVCCPLRISEPKIGVFENPPSLFELRRGTAGAERTFGYVSTGSAENHDLQAGEP